MVIAPGGLPDRFDTEETTELFRYLLSRCTDHRSAAVRPERYSLLLKIEGTFPEIA